MSPLKGRPKTAEHRRNLSRAKSGVLALAVGAVLALDPSAGILSLVLVIGIYAIVAGLAELVFAIRLLRPRRGVSQTVSHLTHSA